MVILDGCRTLRHLVSQRFPHRFTKGGGNEGWWAAGRRWQTRPSEQVTASGLIQINARSGEASETLSTAPITRFAVPPALSCRDMLDAAEPGERSGEVMLPLLVAPLRSLDFSNDL